MKTLIEILPYVTILIIVLSIFWYTLYKILKNLKDEF